MNLEIEGVDDGVRKLAIIITGTSGTGVGSSIRGYAKRGGYKLMDAHGRNSIVAMTAETNTTKVCFACQTEQEAVKATLQKEDGTTTMKVVNGAKRCPNPDCERVKARMAVLNRDCNAAWGMAIAGGSEIYTGQRPPAYRRQIHVSRPGPGLARPPSMHPLIALRVHNMTPDNIPALAPPGGGSLIEIGMPSPSAQLDLPWFGHGTPRMCKSPRPISLVLFLQNN